MQCVEFESRLNHLLDERISPASDGPLADHAGTCGPCADLLATHELLVEGVAALPAARLCATDERKLAQRVVAEVGSAALRPFPPQAPVELAPRRAAVVEARPRTPKPVIWLTLAAAATILIALIPWFRNDRQPAVPERQLQKFAVDDAAGSRSHDPAVPGRAELEPIAWVGFQVADRLKPVTHGMVTAFRELRKRPLFRNFEESGRSSFYNARDEREIFA
jgi:hypothetical protein